jgi:hypothetical protein
MMLYNKTGVKKMNDIKLEENENTAAKVIRNAYYNNEINYTEALELANEIFYAYEQDWENEATIFSGIKDGAEDLIKFCSLDESITLL